MAQAVVGTNAFSEQPQTDTFEQGTGRTTVKIYRGPRELYEAKWTELEGTSPDSMSGKKGTPAEITATYLPVDSNVDTAVWELIPTAVDRPLATHPSFNTGSTQQAQIEAIDKAVAQGNSQNTDWDAKFGVTGLNDYRNLRAKGTDSFRMWSYVVRRTLTTSLASIESANDQDAGQVVTWGGIGIPGSIKFSQPVYNKFDAGGDPEGTAIPIDQWLTTPETVRYERKMYTITKEWLGSLAWYSVLYPGGSAASTTDGTNIG